MRSTTRGSPRRSSATSGLPRRSRLRPARAPPELDFGADDDIVDDDFDNDPDFDDIDAADIDADPDFATAD